MPITPLRRLVRLFVLVALTGAALVSCGGDDAAAPAPTATSVPAISKTDFITAANARCTEFNTWVDALPDPETEEQAYAMLEDQMIPEFFDVIADIRALGFPAGDEALLADLLDRTDAITTQALTDIPAFVNSDADPYADINDALLDYGLTVCGES